MNIRCLNCGNVFPLKTITNDELGFHTICNKCKSSFDVNMTHIIVNSFIGDYEKMADFKKLTKLQFLENYCYTSSEEYDSTKIYYDWLRGV